MKQEKYSAEIGGFIIAPDIVTQELGLISSCIYGKIWRYERMRDGVCKAAIKTIADELKISYNTVLAHIEKLIAAGYVIDTTPGLRNHPHAYKTTGRLKIEIGIVCAGGDEDSTTESTPQKLHSRKNSTPQKLRTAPQNLISDSSNFGDEEYRLFNRDNSPIGESPTPNKGQDQRQMVGILAKVTGLDLKIRTNAGRLAKRGKELLTAGYSPDQVEQIYSPGGWWFANDWRGKRGQKPKPEDIGETIKAAVDCTPKNTIQRSTVTREIWQNGELFLERIVSHE